MKKTMALVLALIMVMMLFTSCGAKAEANDMMVADRTEGGYMTSDGSYPEKESEEMAKDEVSLERKIIKTYRVRMETLAYDEATTLISSAAQSFGGYIAEASQEGVSSSASSYSTRSATYTVRIPAERADAYIEFISGDCNVLSSSLTTQDVTDSYYGYQARLDSLVIQEERLAAMMEKAETLTELLTLEDKLSEVRAEINGINSSLQLMEKSVSYSYVYVTLREVKEYQEPEEESYLSRMGSSFVGAFKSFVNVLGEILIVLIWVLPYLIVAAVILMVLIVYNVRRKRKKTNEDNEKKD
jgi:cytochrome c-type biogenesis protein CcmH/NrfF